MPRSAATQLRLMTPVVTPVAPANPAPYTVRKFPALRGVCTLLVHDWQGEPAFKVEYPVEKVTPELLRRLHLHAQDVFGPPVVKPDLRIG